MEPWWRFSSVRQVIVGFLVITSACFGGLLGQSVVAASSSDRQGGWRSEAMLWTEDEIVSSPTTAETLQVRFRECVKLLEVYVRRLDAESSQEALIEQVVSLRRYLNYVYATVRIGRYDDADDEMVLLCDDVDVITCLLARNIARETVGDSFYEVGLPEAVWRRVLIRLASKTSHSPMISFTRRFRLVRILGESRILADGAEFQQVPDRFIYSVRASSESGDEMGRLEIINEFLVQLANVVKSDDRDSETLSSVADVSIPDEESVDKPEDGESSTPARTTLPVGTILLLFVVFVGAGGAGGAVVAWRNKEKAKGAGATRASAPAEGNRTSGGRSPAKRSARSVRKVRSNPLTEGASVQQKGSSRRDTVDESSSVAGESKAEEQTTDLDSSSIVDPLLHALPRGRFSRFRLLGAGGMGRVYAALDQARNRFVAVKILGLKTRENPKVVKRLAREASVLATLDHPNIVDVYEFSLEPLPYIVMELLEGQTLDSHLAEHGSMDLPSVVELGCTVLAALDHAHANGVIHRDMKPGNVMLLGDGTIKLVDFGIARIAHATDLTATGQLIGTLAWMAPEQLAGGQITALTDLWSVGALLYGAATGQPPFGVQRFMSTLNDAPAPPSTVCPSLPSSFDGVIVKALAANPANRHPSAENFRQALRSVCPEDGVS